ncbi:MAG: T9SS type A sorting domain-containing protein, partial [Gemmatimonadales bacterium]|nr:T9SS type A sorting domain-containing protein [Gemmatimonadales bacterium]
IVAWGSNYKGRLEIPEPNSDFVAISAGWEHALGLKADGSIVPWGLMDNFHCGGHGPNADFIAISGSPNYKMGLRSDGSIMSWGNTRYDLDTILAPNENFVAIEADRSHNLALRADGSIVAWGHPSSRDLCDVPEPNSDFVAIDSGECVNLALKSDGSIVSWGSDGFAQVPSPNADFVSAAVYLTNCLALKADGSLVSWGVSLGDDELDPVPDGHFVAIDVGDRFNLGLKSDGSVLVWGNPIGLCSVPEPNSDFVAISASGSGDTCLGIKSDGSVVSWTITGQVIEVNDPQENAFAISSPPLMALISKDPQVFTCQIDIKPGSEINPINCKQPQNGTIPVAVLGSGEFDVTTLDQATIRFGPDEATAANHPGHNNNRNHIRHSMDINHDGHPDLMFHFRLAETGIHCGDTEATLTGETFDGEPVLGTDVIRTVPKGGIDPASERIVKVSPNPFNPMALVSFKLDQSQQVHVSVYDIRGRRVADVSEQHYEPGEHVVIWKGQDSTGRSVPSGEYFFRVEMDDRVETRKALLLR